MRPAFSALQAGLRREGKRVHSAAKSGWLPSPLAVSICEASLSHLGHRCVISTFYLRGSGVGAAEACISLAPFKLARSLAVFLPRLCPMMTASRRGLGQCNRLRQAGNGEGESGGT